MHACFRLAVTAASFAMGANARADEPRIFRSRLVAKMPMLDGEVYR